MYIVVHTKVVAKKPFHSLFIFVLPATCLMDDEHRIQKHSTTIVRFKKKNITTSLDMPRVSL